MEWTYDADTAESTLTRRWSFDDEDAARAFAGQLDGEFATKRDNTAVTRDAEVSVDGTDVVLRVISTGTEAQHHRDIYLGVTARVATTLFNLAYEVNPAHAKEAAWSVYDQLPEPRTND